MCCIVHVVIHGEMVVVQQSPSCQLMQLPFKLVVSPLAASKSMHCIVLLCHAHIVLLLGHSCEQHCFRMLPE